MIKTVCACELKVGDYALNIGKITKINTEVFPKTIYYSIYGENNIYPNTFDGLADVYIEESGDMK